MVYAVSVIIFVGGAPTITEIMEGSMTRLAKFEVKAGNYVIVEVDDADGDLASQKPETDFANAARVTFDEVLSLVRSMADKVASGMNRLRHPATGGAPFDGHLTTNPATAIQCSRIGTGGRRCAFRQGRYSPPWSGWPWRFPWRFLLAACSGDARDTTRSSRAD